MRRISKTGYSNPTEKWAGAPREVDRNMSPARNAMEFIVRDDLHLLSADEVLKLLATDGNTGLSISEVAARQERFGLNVIPPARGRSAWLRFLLQFHSPLVYLLLLAVMITAVFHEWVDAGVIFSVVLLNAVIGFLQETSATKALAALTKATLAEASVVRGGAMRRIVSTQLVPGDIVLLQSGDKVPADVRLIECRNLHVNESTLTGESLPVEKQAEAVAGEATLAERRCLAFASTLVTHGQARGVVYATGTNTQIGHISELISTADVLETPLTRNIAKFSRLLLYLISGFAALTVLIGWLRGEPLLETLMAAVALAVGAIPEGLPAAVTITLSIGVARMARRRAIIRKLPAVETLGSTTVVCSDKTGTLTVNQMTVREIMAGGVLYEVSGSGYVPLGEIHGVSHLNAVFADNAAALECVLAGVLCNDSTLENRDGRWDVHGDPTEGALLAAAAKARLEQGACTARFTRIDTLPFESEHQYMATFHSFGCSQKRKLYVKGALEAILPKCIAMLDVRGRQTPIDNGFVRRQLDNMAAKGLRVLAFATADVPADHTSISDRDVQGLCFAGLQGMIDPPRPDAIKAVRACQSAGIAVKMITGDHPATAQAIAQQIGIDSDFPMNPSRSQVLTGSDLIKLSDAQLITSASQVAVFARVTPDQKLRLVRALQQSGHIVAMTGDGVNDAPALKQADIGVAMGMSGTEAAKEASDMILTDDNFATIEAAIEEGRGVFDNLTKFIVWTLPTNLGEGLIILAALFAGTTLPILPAQILWINMTTGILLGLTLAFETKEDGIMRRPPRDPQAPILTNVLVGRVVLVALIMLAGAFGSFEWAVHHGVSEAAARTVAVNAIVVVELFYLFNCRSLTKSMFQLGVLSNPWIALGVTCMVVAQLLFTYVPFMNWIFHSEAIGWNAWWRILLTGVVAYGIVGLEKWIRRRNDSQRVHAPESLPAPQSEGLEEQSSRPISSGARR